MHHAVLKASEPPSGHRITRLACAFDGCAMPPAFTRTAQSKLCQAHAKQKCRGQKLRPYTPRSNPEAAWQRWAERRASRASGLGLQLKHAGPCGGAMRVYVKNPNGVIGKRTCVCTKCRHFVQVMPDGSMYRTGEVRS